MLYTGIHGEKLKSIGKWPTNPRCDKLTHLQRRKSNKRETKVPAHQNVVINSIKRKTCRNKVKYNIWLGAVLLLRLTLLSLAVYLNKSFFPLKKKSTIAVNISRLKNTIKRHVAGQGGSHPILVIVRLK